MTVRRTSGDSHWSEGVFFAELDNRDFEPLLDHVVGTIRFDLTDAVHTRHWFVRIDKGHVSVSRGRHRADAWLRCDARLFGRLVAGQQNALTSVLRGEVEIGGDLSLVMAFERLFPGPPRT
jgi:hypothetical protein